MRHFRAACNGQLLFKFNEALSLQGICETQAEIDHYWEKLSAGGDPTAQQCGWLMDKYGVSWQVVPKQLIDMLSGQPTEPFQRAMSALLQMKKLDIVALERASGG